MTLTAVALLDPYCEVDDSRRATGILPDLDGALGMTNPNTLPRFFESQPGYLNLLGRSAISALAGVADFWNSTLFSGKNLLGHAGVHHSRFTNSIQPAMPIPRPP